MAVPFSLGRRNKKAEVAPLLPLYEEPPPLVTAGVLLCLFAVISHGKVNDHPIAAQTGRALPLQVRIVDRAADLTRDRVTVLVIDLVVT